jgi:hypothetical protein
MIASIRKLDCCGKEIWRTTTAHGAELSIDFDSELDALACVIANCRRAKAWPLTIDVYYTPKDRPTPVILGEHEQAVWWFYDRKHAIETAAATSFDSWADAAEFQLKNDPPIGQRPRRFESQERTLQKVLIDGLACLPNQLDLF